MTDDGSKEGMQDGDFKVLTAEKVAFVPCIPCRGTSDYHP